MSDKMRYVYVVGMGFSGSTILSMLMNAHPQVASVGEMTRGLNRNTRYRCSCGVDVNQCEFWKKVKHLCSERSMELDLHNFKTTLDAGLGKKVNQILFGVPNRFVLLQTLRDAFLRQIPVFRHMSDSCANQNMVIAQAILDVEGKNVFMDATKDVARAFYLSVLEEFDFKLIHLVRSPQGFLYSCLKRNGNTHLRGRLDYWVKTQQRVLRLKSRLSSNSYLLVRYESLCDNPSGVLAEICSFIGVEYVNLVDFAKTHPHHIMGNQNRVRDFSGIRLDEKWRNSLTQEQIAECARITGDTSKVLGYKII